MKFLAIDFGRKRVGLAISDESETFALPFDTLEAGSGKASAARLAEALLEIVRREEVGAIVFGLPKTASGEAGEMENATRAFGRKLQGALAAANLNIELFWWDERFSTASVLKSLRSAGVSQKSARAASGKDSLDARAATVILQDFLDARKLRASLGEETSMEETNSEDSV